MGLVEAVQWWEVWQLRLLVLGSLLLQLFLIVAAALRRRRTPPWFSFLTWAAYQGSDILPIYALATIFNRAHDQQRLLAPRVEALWAPIMLLHLGGQDGITAYSIQDSELWQRHLVTAVSQIGVAIFVFCNSWTRGDKSLLPVGILLFIPGSLKCLEKPFALWRASLSSMAITVGSRACRIMDDNMGANSKMADDISLDEFVKEASSVYKAHAPHTIDDAGNDEEKNRRQRVPAVGHRVKHDPSRLLVDIPYPYSVRLANLTYMSKKDGDRAHRRLRSGLSKAFNRLYTNYKGYPGAVLRALLVLLTFVAIRLFKNKMRHGGGAADSDLTVTYVLLSCTAALECVSTITLARCRMMSEPPWPDHVAQCNLLVYVARGRKQWKLVRMLASWLPCLDRLRCDTSRSSSRPPSPGGIVELVHSHISTQWKEHIIGTSGYQSFSNSRGEWTLTKENHPRLMSSVQRPFDESVVLWHLATEFCFLSRVDDGSKENLRCREISNYMVYLLLVHPEMLMPGARSRTISWIADDQLVREMLGEGEEDDGAPDLGLGRKMIGKLKAQAGARTTAGLVGEAWALASELMKIMEDDRVGGEAKMWRVIRGVWVEMLCFSAGRCSGYLHARSLGTGGEFLSYVWLLREYMGLETMAHTMQRPSHCMPGPSASDSDSDSDSCLEQEMACPSSGNWYFGCQNYQTGLEESRLQESQSTTT